MYEELIKSLRDCAESNTTRSCITCPWALHKKGCITARVTAAADAIEELLEDAPVEIVSGAIVDEIMEADDEQP